MRTVQLDYKAIAQMFGLLLLIVIPAAGLITLWVTGGDSPKQRCLSRNVAALRELNEGRNISDAALQIIRQNCDKNPNYQI